MRNTLVLLALFAVSASAQEWVKPSAGREEYVQDRSACVREAQSLALTGDAFQRDIADCLRSRGWRHAASERSAEMFCIERPAARACKAGANEAVYMKDRAECYDYMIRTVGTTYQRPGWRGLGGLIVSSIQAEQNRENLQKLQLATVRICLEGKGWAVELKPGIQSAFIEPDTSATPAAPPPASSGGEDPRDRMNRPAAAEPTAVTPNAEPPPRPGQWTFVVEKLAHSQQCEATSVNVVASGTGFENYSVPCSSGDVLVVRCDHGNCRVLK